MYRIVYCLMLIGLSACGGETPSSQLPYFTSTDMTPVFISDGNVDSSFLKQVHSFSLVGQDGDRVTEASLSNRPYVANFFFTECTGICPTLRTRLTAVQKAFDSDDLTMLSVSIADQDQDLSKLKAYSKVNGIQSEMWKLVTGDSNAIQHFALDSFGARLDLNGNLYAHTETVYLVDAHGFIRGLYNGTLEVEIMQLLNDLQILVSENLDVT
ncbi:MAG: SCO family protein [Bacteroidetes Order II. Incertae sedis bacterium]|nr:SCO family protein [Bacteroidetes Order II. bacterium]MBT4052939.1 SCO family protein [Bacteroidetes Order II. bacterium]MBT6199283.1 SCO family protein [Bacteroidetes Order II. bacterium]MBT6423679.1 SCO family protein [Bacteroidetes Order II. bacterium]MBT6598995.1 SCO family protein [Bacteroidetes Order II. bacterium]